MKTWLEIFSAPAWTTLVYTLLHTLWQGALAALILGVCLRGTSSRRPGRRYGAALGALAGVVLGAAFTWGILDWMQKHQLDQNGPRMEGMTAPYQALPKAVADSVAPATPARAALEARETASAWVAWVALAWFAGCLWMSVRFLSQLVGIHWLRRYCLPVTDVWIHEVAGRLKQRLHIRQSLQLLTHPSCDMPAVFGVWAPKLLLPAALLTGIPAGQLEAIIAHELAHIRRRDYLVNLGQQLVEVLLFFNPAVWWINRQIRIEREACCDRLAIAVTGQPEVYAESIVHWAERTQRAVTGLELAPAFGLQDRSQGPLERLKRILLPKYQPAIRLPWHTFLGVMLTSGVLLCVVWQGARLAVDVAADILTPEQRVNKIAQIQKVYTTPQPGSIPDNKAERVNVSGLARTEDGQTWTETATLYLRSERPRYTAAYSTTVRQGRFSQVVNPGKIYLGLEVAGYAPTLAGPYETEKGQSLENLELVLRKGYAGLISMVDPSGNPLLGVEIQIRFAHPLGDSFRKTIHSDAAGMARMELCQNYPVHLQATMPGYQYDAQSDIRLSAEKAFRWELKKARPTTGLVVDSQSGQPVSGAEFRCLCREGVFPEARSQPEYATVLGKTDAQGRFRLDTLNDNTFYTLYVGAPNHAPEIVHDIQAGQGPLKISLNPPLYIRGKIVGGLDGFREYDGRKSLIYAINLPLGRSRTLNSHQQHAPVEIRDGEAFFEITNLWRGKVEIFVGHQVKFLEVRQPITDLVLDTRLPGLVAEPVGAQLTQTTRPLIIRFSPPTGQPRPQGAFKFQRWSNATRQGQICETVLTNGETMVDGLAPGGVLLEAKNLSGYWFSQVVRDVPAGTTALVMEIPVIPAGAVYGKVLNEDGSEADNVMLSALEVKSSPLIKENHNLGVEIKNSSSQGDGPTRFTAQPLPLGGTYAIIAHRGNSYVMSDPVKLTEERPLQDVTLQFVRGQEVYVKFLGEDKVPVQPLEYSFSLNTPYNRSLGAQGIAEKEAGLYRFAAVNPTVPGQYTVSAKALGYQTAFQPVSLKTRTNVMVLKRGFTLKGVVISGDSNQPVSGVQLYAIPETWQEGDTSVNTDFPSDENGEFVFSSMARRKYKLQVVSPYQPSGSASWPLVTGGQKEPLTLKVERYLP